MDKTPTYVEGLKHQLAELREEAKLNASMLARQTDLAREAEAKLAEKDEALGAMAELGLDIAASAEHQDACPKGKAIRRWSKQLNAVIPNPAVEAAPCECGLTEAIERLDAALAPEAVQKALEMGKKLAVAMGLLERWLITEVDIMAETRTFLADSSQAVAQYREALAVVTRAHLKLAELRAWRAEHTGGLSSAQSANDDQTEMLVEILGEEKP